jgi:hypothetical protein
LLNRRELITGATGIAAASMLRSRPAYARDKKPNLLYILADDHAGYVLGADGNAMAVTPNLDRLASEGTRFAQYSGKRRRTDGYVTDNPTPGRTIHLFDLGKDPRRVSQRRRQALRCRLRRDAATVSHDASRRAIGAAKPHHR